MKKIALLVDEHESALIVGTAVECAGFRCETYDSMTALLRAARRDEHVVIIVDTSRADVDCHALVAWRDSWLSAEQAIIAIGPNDALSAARNLELGIDDFVAKPVRGAELIARIAAAIRRRDTHRTSGPKDDLLSFGGCVLDCTSSCIVSNSSRVSLTTREMTLARSLFENAGQLVSRNRLAREVWGASVELSRRSIEQHVYQLRRKMKRCVGDALVLQGVYGSGYRIDAPSGLAHETSITPRSGGPTAAQLAQACA